MKEREVKCNSRRKALATFIRWGACGLFACGGGYLLAKRSTFENRDKCIGNGFCDNCGLLSDCELPKAVSARQSSRE